MRKDWLAYPWVMLRPGERLMGRLTFGPKLLLISLVFLIPVGLGVYGVASQLSESIAFSTAELDGSRVLRPLRSALEASIRAEGARPEARVAVSEGIEAVVAADLGGPRRYLASRLPDLRLKAAQDAEGREAEAPRLRPALIDAINHVADQSNLILDPDLDTYYLMDAVVLRIPEALSILADVEAQARAPRPVGGADGTARAHAAQLRGRLVAVRDVLERGSRVAAESSREGVDPARTAVPMAAFTARIEPLLRALAQEEGGDVGGAAATALAAGFALWDANVVELDRLLGLRVEHLMGRRRVELGTTGVALGLVAYLWIAFYASVRRTVRALTEAPSRIAEGRFDVVTVPTKDELGQVVASFNAVGAQLRAEWTAARAEESRAREAETLARREQAFLERILETALNGIVICDPKGLVREWNPSAVGFFGVGREEALGRLADELIPCVGKEGARHPLARARAGDLLNQHLELRSRRPDGVEFPIEVTMSRIEAVSEIAYAIFVRDLTEQNQLEVQLRQTQKLESIGQLAAGIAHEINTPIQYISDNLTFLQGAFSDLQALVREYQAFIAAAEGGAIPTSMLSRIRDMEGERDLAFLEQNVPGSVVMALDGAGRVTQIVRAMKEFSHPGSTEKTPTDLNKAIETTLTVARNEWKYVAEAVTQFDPDLPAVPCLPGEVNQVLLNLIVNAAHAIGDAVKDTPETKGKITIATRIQGPFAEIRITDTGRGIPDEVKARMFEPFFTTKAVGKGTGQGLTIARNVVVKKHGGTIDFESEVGRGTTFTVRLPLEAPRTVPIGDGQPAAA